ncbi:hypothetical protein GCM10010411_69470 [Actinomadura fulvescens]|uniref:Uncharacterized protein n=1 Tax=Actinomadura fulvescens TaxID=46160 RepID=A0ABN3QDA4_9ACTN
MPSIDRPREPSESDTARRTSDAAMTRLNALFAAARAHKMPVEVTSADGGQNYYIRGKPHDRSLSACRSASACPNRSCRLMPVAWERIIFAACRSKTSASLEAPSPHEPGSEPSAGRRCRCMR